MNIKFPVTIDNGHGQTIIFPGMENDRVFTEGTCQPGAGPAMHVHYKQDEGFTVISGKMGYQTLGEEPRYAGPGESMSFRRGVPHRFWAEGNEPLTMKGWLEPANNIVFFLSALYAAQRKSGSEMPDRFDAAFLLTRYHSEFDMPALPGFVRKVIIPVTYFIGKLTGKYAHFKDAPEPV